MPSLDGAEAHLSRRDPVLRKLIERVGPCRLRPSRNKFLTLVEAIVSQQLSTRAASSVYNKLLDAVGRKNPGPHDILDTPPEALARAGLSRRKISYILDVSRLFAGGELSARKLARMSDEELVEELTRIRGIGRWTVEMYLIFALGRPDVLPTGDLGLKKAMADNYGLDRLPSEEEMHRIAEPWRPYRTVGTWYMWMSFDNVPWIR